MHIMGVSNTADTDYFDREMSQKVSFKTAAGDQDFTVYGDSYANARAGLPFINASTGSSNNGGTAAMPGSFAPTTSMEAPWDSTYSTYSRSTPYTLDAKTAYLNNSAPTSR